MKIRTLFILFTFALLFVVNKISLHKDIKRQNENLTVVNISGKQRMYSQKITKLAIYNLEKINKLSTNNKLLKETLAKFSLAHQNLKNNFLEKYDDEYLNELYKELSPNYMALVENTNLILQGDLNFVLLKKSINKIRIASNNFLPIMNDIVNQYERIGKDRGEIILQREFTFNIIMIFLSLYAIFFIVFPMINAYQRNELLSLF